MSFELDHIDSKTHPAMQHNRRHISDEQWRAFEAAG